MKTTVTVLLVLLYIAYCHALSCEPCECYVDNDSNSSWSNLQIATCNNVSSLSVVPSTDMLPDNTQVLNINGGSITTIKQNQFISLKNLQVIYIERNKVTYVEIHAFRNMTNVTEISFRYNLITELPTGIFSDTPNLITLWLFANKLNKVQKNLFSNLKYLKLVSLSDNQITSVEVNSFVNVPLLESLYLYSNNLTSLSLTIMDNSNSLKIWYLHRNPWHCDESLCRVMEVVASRELWGSLIIPTCATPQNLLGKRWSQLREHDLLRQCSACSPCLCAEPTVVRCSTPLKLSHVLDRLPPNITHLHFTDQQTTTIHSNAFSTHGLLEELILERNKINTVEHRSFENLCNLTVLSLAENNITILNQNIFSYTPYLIKLLLNNNRLRKLKNCKFSNLVMLKELDLSYNEISFIEEGCFVNVSSLRTINLSNNQLQTMQLNVIDDVSGLEYLYLYGNPWRCDETLCGVLDTVVQAALWGTDPVPVCASPPTMAGKLWSQLLDKFQPSMLILDTNQYWTKAPRTTSVLEAREVTLQCRYCFVSRVTWTLNGVKLPRSYQQISKDSLISTLTMEKIHKEDQGEYVCQVSQCPECDTVWLYVSINKSLPGKAGVKQVFYVADDTCSVQYCYCNAIENTTELAPL